MKLPTWFLQLALGGAITVLVGLESWTLNAVVDLKVEVAALKSAVNHNQTNIAQNEQQPIR